MAAAVMFGQRCGQTKLPSADAIQANLRDLRTQINSAMQLVLMDHTASTISRRMERAQLVQRFYDMCAVLCQHCMFYGGEPRDPTTELNEILTTCVATYYSSANTQGDSHAHVSGQYRQLRRMIVDCKSMFQPLAAFFGKDHIESSILKIAASYIMTIPNFGSQQLIAIAAFGALPELRSRYAAIKDDPKSFSELRDQIRDCFRLAMDLTFGNERPRLVANLRSLYSDAVLSQQESVVIGDVDEYLQKMSNVLDREFDIASQVFPQDPSAPEVVKRKLQQGFLSPAATKQIVEDKKSGVLSTLQYPNLNASKFRVLLNVFDFSANAVQTIKEEFEGCVAAALKPLNDAKDNITVQSIAAVHSTFALFVSHGTQEHHRQVFLRVLNKALAAVLNPSIMAAVVGDEIDQFIRKGPKQQLDQADMIKTIDKFAALVPAACDMDLFRATYQQRLAQRLLTTRHPVIPLEELALRRLAIHLSVDEVAPLYHMLHEAVNVRPVEGVSLCNSFTWPPSVREFDGSRLPAELSSSMSALINGLDLGGRRPHLQLEPDYWLSTGVVCLSVGASKCTVYGIVPQLAVLSHLFGEVDGPQTVVAVSERLGVEPHTGFCLLRSIVGSGLIRNEAKLFAADAKAVEEHHGKKISLPAVPRKSLPTMGVAGDVNAVWPSPAPPRPPAVQPKSDRQVAIERHLQKKEHANGLFKTGKYTEALREYREATKIIAHFNPATDDEVAGLNNTIRSNIILTNLKLKRYTEVLLDANDFFLQKPPPANDLRKKTAIRRGQASMALSDFQGAINDFLMAKTFVNTPDPALDALLQDAQDKLNSAKQRR